MLTITETAGEQIKDMIKQEGSDDLFLRIGVQGGGCSGLSYGMGFDETLTENDIELTQHGIKILVDKNDESVLKGVVIDYKENALGGGFTIDNPNAIATCGCGSSFKTKDREGTPEEC